MLFYCCYGLFKAWLTLFCRLAITLLTSDPILERLVRGRLRAHRDCLPVLPVDRLFQMAPAIPPASISPNTRPVAASPAFCDCGWKHYFKKRFFKICSIRLKETPRYIIGKINTISNYKAFFIGWVLCCFFTYRVVDVWRGRIGDGVKDGLGRIG